MKNRDVFVPAGEKCCCIRIMRGGPNNNDIYFAGYDFMGSINWTDDIRKACRYNNLEEPFMILRDINLSEE